MNQSQAGLYRKFNVSRVDGRDQPGGDRAGAEYFVLDLTHDEFAKQALTAYARAGAAQYPMLSLDMVRRYGLDDTPPDSARIVPAAPDIDTIRNLAADLAELGTSKTLPPGVVTTCRNAAALVRTYPVTAPAGSVPDSALVVAAQYALDYISRIHGRPSGQDVGCFFVGELCGRLYPYLSEEGRTRNLETSKFIASEFGAGRFINGKGTACSVPEGYALVPVEPTEDMIRAACLNQGSAKYPTYEEWRDEHSSGISERIRGYIVRDYRAMLAAAQKGGA